MKAGFCVSGNGSLFRSAVVQRELLSIEPRLVVVETKAAADLELFSSANGVRCVRLDPVDRPAFDRELTRTLIEAELDLIALTFDRVLPPDLVCHYAGRIINVHPALLPAFAGMRGIERTLASGSRIGGATVHEVIDAVDAGPIIAQLAITVLVEDTVQSYGARMYKLLEPMFLQVLRWYAEGRVRHDESGRIIVRDACYDALPIVPALERFS